MHKQKTKICTDCKKEKTLEYFSINRNKKDGLNYRCKECQRIYFKQYYHKNRKEQIQRVKKRTKKTKQIAYKLLDTYKLDKGCSICGYNEHAVALQFHHKDPSVKRDTISQLVGRGCNLNTIQKEIKKCEVICANCHAILHYNERNNK